MYEYMKHVKSIVRLALDKAKHGGKKAKAGKNQKKDEAADKPIENCALFVAKEYPEWKQHTL